MKVLVAVDDSTFSEKAVDFVEQIPWGPDTEVVVLSVARSPMMLSTEVYAAALSYDDDIMKRELELHHDMARRAEARLRRSHPNTTSQVTDGDPRIEIIDAAGKMKADLIVLGSHGRTGLSRLLMGSVASYVSTHASCSVLVVKKAGTTTSQQ